MTAQLGSYNCDLAASNATLFSRSELDVSDKAAVGPSGVSPCIPSHPVMVPGIPDADWSKLKYQHGFANQFSTEALPGALPKYQNNPQRCPYHLYAEQLSGTAFTARRVENFRTWMYRILPSVTHEPFQPIENPKWKVSSDFDAETPTPNQLRWSPLPIPGPEEQVDFVDGLQTICGAGSPAVKDGYGIHMYCANVSMERSCLCNADGNFLIVPQHGTLRVATEMGLLEAPPGYILVVPRGIRFSVALPDGPSRGYVLEAFAGQFVLPELGPIGANGLANPRDFEAPVAAFDDTHRSDFTFNVLHKFGGKLFQAQQNFSPFNVVSWHGNYYPYRYPLCHPAPLAAQSRWESSERHVHGRPMAASGPR
ncbi:hypothetical protein CYMTET_20015 [Cymbomonas tetramitiformis]|uniref:homogentisate 1,2-dioxygenase n=1 Tax=Cymbomonas tetramitiformis TaxID=36881 RepID=A0AAE0L4A9_9CHLO|nr:hypothetical protein CYMTET_20015 [Cymbomonas tetramitiformis]